MDKGSLGYNKDVGKVLRNAFMNNRTAREAGWKYSDYNLYARVPGTDKIAWLNTLSGSCSEFSPKEYALIGKVLDRLEENPLIRHYAGRGLITKIDEKEEIRRRLRESCSDPKILYLTICPTLACNFDCPYCFETHVPGKMKPDVIEAIVRFAERMIERHPFETLKVLWFGGEPLLCVDLIEEISERLMMLADVHAVEYRAEIITNGCLLDEHAIEVLDRAGTVKAQITLDGLAESHNKTRCLRNGEGTFDTIVDNIRRQKIPFLVEIRHNVMRENRTENEPLKEFVRSLAEESGNKITYYASPIFESEAARKRNSSVSVLESGEDLSFVYEDALERFTDAGMNLCQAAQRYSLIIDPEGKLYTCSEKAGNPSEMYGTILDYDPDDSVRTAVHPETNEYYLSADSLFETCGDCVFLPKCLGECPAKRRAGKPECPLYKEDPESYVLHIYKELKAMREAKKREGGREAGGLPNIAAMDAKPPLRIK